MAIIHAALKRSTGLASRFMTLSLMSGMKQSIDRIPGEKYQKLSAKVEDVLARNPGVAVLKAFRAFQAPPSFPDYFFQRGYAPGCKAVICILSSA